MENNQNKNFTFEVGSNWDQQKTKLQEKYSQLTDSDLQCQAGQERELLARLQSKLNKNEEEVMSILNQVRSETGSNQGNQNSGNQGSFAQNQQSQGNQSQTNDTSYGQSNNDQGKIDDSDFSESNVNRSSSTQGNTDETDNNDDDSNERQGRAF